MDLIFRQIWSHDFKLRYLRFQLFSESFNLDVALWLHHGDSFLVFINLVLVFAKLSQLFFELSDLLHCFRVSNAASFNLVCHRLKLSLIDGWNFLMVSDLVFKFTAFLRGLRIKKREWGVGIITLLQLSMSEFYLT